MPVAKVWTKPWGSSLIIENYYNFLNWFPMIKMTQNSISSQITDQTLKYPLTSSVRRWSRAWQCSPAENCVVLPQGFKFFALLEFVFAIKNKNAPPLSAWWYASGYCYIFRREGFSVQSLRRDADGYDPSRGSELRKGSKKALILKKIWRTRVHDARNFEAMAFWRWLWPAATKP
jgi:hypothetical protein